MSDTRYLENMLYRNVFVKVAKDRKIKNGMTGKVWLSLTEKAKEIDTYLWNKTFYWR